jgi:hypothetical protein
MRAYGAGVRRKIQRHISKIVRRQSQINAGAFERSVAQQIGDRLQGQA